MALLASGIPVATIGIILAASGGFIAALVALLKLKPEANQYAVLQAQGAMETMAQLQDELEKALARERARADRYQARFVELERRYDRAVELWGPFPETAEKGPT